METSARYIRCTYNAEKDDLELTSLNGFGLQVSVGSISAVTLPDLWTVSAKMLKALGNLTFEYTGVLKPW